MTDPLPGQPPPGPTLTAGLRLLREGREDEANALLKKAAVGAKRGHGSGSGPLARAYADMARLHAAAGDYTRAATEFKHVCEYPAPADPAGMGDRLAFLFGFAGCAAAAGRADEAEKVFRQCATYARDLFGPGTPDYAVALEPLAAFLLRAGKLPEAVRLLDEAYDVLWQHGDPQVVDVVPARAEALKAAGRADDPFANLVDLPDDLCTAVVARVLGRGAGADPVRRRKVLADLARFAEKKFGPGHPAAVDVLSAVVRHEGGLGPKADTGARAAAARKVIWAAATRQLPRTLLADLEVGIDPDGALHLVPHLAREATAAEVERMERVLTAAVENLYAPPPAGG